MEKRERVVHHANEYTLLIQNVALLFNPYYGRFFADGELNQFFNLRINESGLNDFKPCYLRSYM
jgi:hypothetical protein